MDQTRRTETGDQGKAASASLDNLTPADVSFGRAKQILKQREEIKRKTMLSRRLRHKTENAQTQSKMSQSLQMKPPTVVPIYLTSDKITVKDTEFIMKGQLVENLPGRWPVEGIAIVRFPSIEIARASYASPEHQAQRASILCGQYGNRTV